MKNIKVFISSTFNDLAAERNKIMLAFREAEKYAIENYVNLKTIDFRWGLPDGAHVMKSCLESISMSKPYFLCILGGKYGSVPTWDDYIKEKDYLVEYNEFIEKNVFKSESKDSLSYTAMEVYYALSQGFDKDKVRFLHLSYKKEMDSKQQKLIDYVQENGYSLVECSTPEVLVKEVSHFLTSIIDANSLINNNSIDDDNNATKCHFVGFDGDNTQQKQLGLYRKQQESILNYTVLDSFSRKQERFLDGFVDGPSNVCCIEGEDGSGKSTLLARWINNRVNKKNSDEIIIYHFYQEGFIDDIFEHLYLELADINHRTVDDYYAKLFGVSDCFPRSLSIFKEAIKQIETDKRVLMVLDGIEHWVEGFPGLKDTFFLNNKNIKLIVTTGKVPIDSYEVTVLRLPTLEQDEAKHMIISYLKLHNKTEQVSAEIADLLCTNSIFQNPKLLSSVLYDIRAFASHSNISAKVEKYKSLKDPIEFYNLIVVNWEELIPAIKKNSVLVWLAYSHFGMAEEDIKRIAGFYGDKEYLWHQLFSFIEPYLEWNGNRVQFSNKWLKDAIIQANVGNEKNIKEKMIEYFQNECVSIEKQFDELPYLLKEMNRYNDLLSYLLNLSVFQYAMGNYTKKSDLIDFWSVFELSDFSDYLYLPHDGMSKKDYVELLYELSEFLYFDGNKMFPDEERFDIEALHSLICQSIINELDDVTIKEMEPAQIASVYRSVAVSYIDSHRLEEARYLLEKGIKLLSPKAKKQWKLYETTLMIHQTPEYISFDDKVTMSYVESVTRTSVLKILNPYIDLLGEMINTRPSGNKLKKYYNEVLECIDKLDLMQETRRNTTLLRSTIEYGYGVNLLDEADFFGAFEKFNKAFNLKYDYLLNEEGYLRKDNYQECRLLETYKMIESCQIRLGGVRELFNNQERYVEAVEKYGKNLIVQGKFDLSHYCNCIYNYAAFFYNQTVDKDDNEVKELLQQALKYYDTVVSETKNGLLKEMYIRASFYKIMCLSRMDKDDEVPEILNSILETEKTLSDFERNDNQVAWILETCHSALDDSWNEA